MAEPRVPVFIRDKNTRRCGICTEIVPLSLYAKDSHGIPYKNCRTCNNEKSTREFLERRDAKAKAGGAKPYYSPEGARRHRAQRRNDGVYLWT